MDKTLSSRTKMDEVINNGTLFPRIEKANFHFFMLTKFVLKRAAI